MIGTQSRRSPEIINFQFTEQQARLLDSGSRQTAAIGGPDVAGAADMSAHHAKVLKHSMNTQQRDMLEVFSCGKAAAIEFTAMLTPCFAPVPERLAPIDIINTEPATLYLASRSQILLSLVNYRSFAFDIDNGSMQVRLVGNFKGGGKNLLPDELDHHHVELSSHSGLLLGPHTEPPYNCSINAESGHSPAPSALILTARLNPLQEPTRLIPVCNAVAKLNGLEALALSSKSFATCLSLTKAPVERRKISRFSTTSRFSIINKQQPDTACAGNREGQQKIIDPTIWLLTGCPTIDPAARSTCRTRLIQEKNKWRLKFRYF